MRTKIVAGNWKMNKTAEQTADFLNKLNIGNCNTKVILGIPFPYIALALKDRKSNEILIAAQNAHPKDSGAFTGEVSFAMLKNLGVDACIIGHSERRAMFNETNEFIAQKVEAALAHNILPILCVGETLEERYANKHFEIVSTQTMEALKNVSENDFSKVVIAYEPVWAIGTGQTASSAQAQEMHAFIRTELSKKYGNLANNCSILYGGSCKPDNAVELFSQEDVDGGLIGGASLNTNDFEAIIKAAN